MRHDRKRRSTRLSVLFLLLVLLSLSHPLNAAVIKSGVGANICLATPNDLITIGKQLQIALCDGSGTQQFTLQADGQIRSGSLCIDANTGVGADGNAVLVWFCHGFDSQKWIPTSTGELRSLTGRCMDVPNSVLGTKVFAGPCRGTLGQQWSVVNSVTSTLDASPNSQPASSGSSAADPCSVKEIQLSPQLGLTVWSPDRKQYLVNNEDANGVAQIYVGRKDGGAPVCITCTDKPNGPKANKLKMQPHWHPSGRWIVLAVEQENFTKPFYATPEMIEGWLQCGIWVDMYATNPDGSAWYKLQDFGPANKADGFTGVAFTPDGRKGVWAQIVDGNVLAYTFGRWELILADFQEINGVPSFANKRNITPPDTYWVEPGNFSPNGRDLVLTADQGFPNHARVEGQDQYVLNIDTGQMTNLTKSPGVWDEHGVFSPDGEKIFFMSAHPYRAEPNSSTVLLLKTEFMMMNKDGSNLKQITHFNQQGFPEFSYRGSVAANGEWGPDGASISAINLFFPKYRGWDIKFDGSCGAKVGTP